MATDQMVATSIADAARFDPQLRVPQRPRIRRGVAVDVREDRVIVRGTPTRQRLTGRSAGTVLPRLLPHLTGEHDHASLQALTGLSERHLFSILTLLWTSGAIEDTVERAESLPSVPEPLADLISRLGDSTGRHSAWETSAAALVGTTVAVLGSGVLADAVAVSLGQSSMRAERAADLESVSTGTDLVVLVGPDTGAGKRLYREGIPHVRFAVDGPTARLGPYVHPAFTPCLECATADEPGPATAETDPDLAISLFTRELFAFLSGSTPTAFPMHWTSVHCRSLRQERHSAPTRPGCATCSATEAETSIDPTTAVQFEAAVAFPPREFTGVKAHQAHYKPSNLALQDRDKIWPLVHHHPLPAVTPEALETQNQRLDESSLALLLALICGRDPDSHARVQRWTASGGNIGSVLAHVVVREVPGLQPGVYGYVPGTHALAQLSRHPDRIPGSAPASIVLTGAFGKVSSKYGAFALRIVYLDAGCAVTTAQLAADTLEIPLAPRDRWDPAAIATALSTNAEYEPVTAVIDLGGPR